MSTVRIEVPTSAIDAALRDRIAELTRERDEAKARVYALTTERDEAKARRIEAEGELELARVEADAKPNQSAWEAACRLRKERDDANMRLAHAKAERDGARREREDARNALDDMRKARDQAIAEARIARERGAAAQVEAETMRQERDEAVAASRRSEAQEKLWLQAVACLGVSGPVGAEKALQALRACVQNLRGCIK